MYTVRKTWTRTPLQALQAKMEQRMRWCVLVFKFRSWPCGANKCEADDSHEGVPACVMYPFNDPLRQDLASPRMKFVLTLLHQSDFCLVVISSIPSRPYVFWQNSQSRSVSAPRICHQISSRFFPRKSCRGALARHFLKNSHEKGPYVALVGFL